MIRISKYPYDDSITVGTDNNTHIGTYDLLICFAVQ